MWEVMKTCKSCLKEFEVYRMLPGGEYCSALCLTIRPQQVHIKPTGCPLCGRRSSRGMQKPFCSKKCRKAARGILPSKKNLRFSRKGKVRKVPIRKKKNVVIDLWSKDNESKWQKLRYEAFRKYGRKCMVCKSTESRLHVDHIKPKSKYPELVFDIDNLQILCQDCNYGKSHLHEDDWRPK